MFKICRLCRFVSELTVGGDKVTDEGRQRRGSKIGCCHDRPWHLQEREGERRERAWVAAGTALSE